MRLLTTLALFAAITMMYTAHALPRPDLAVRQDGNDLRNQSHIFHHLDRNQRTANRDRVYANEAERSGLSAVGRVPERSQRAGLARERVVERRFIRSPDYSEGDGPQDGSNSASSASATTATQQPAPQAETEEQPARMEDQ